MTDFRDQLGHFLIEEVFDNSVAYYEKPSYVTVCSTVDSTAN